MYCEICGAKNNDEAKFCKGCGENCCNDINSHPSKVKNNSKKTIIIVILSIIVFIILVIGGMFVYASITAHNKQVAISKMTPDELAQQETDGLVAKVSKLMSLPQDEKPSVATVTDKAKLKDQPFFANAENNDKVLIYTNAKKAILYRPSTDKVIEVMPISFSDGKPSF